VSLEEFLVHMNDTIFGIIDKEKPSIFHDFSLKNHPSNSHRAIVVPNFNLNEVKLSPHLDTLVFKIDLREPKPWNWLRKRISDAIGRSMHIGKIWNDEKGKFDDTEYFATIQDPTLSDIKAILALDFINGTTELEQLDVACDYRRKKHGDEQADDEFRERLVALLARTSRLDPAMISGGGGARVFTPEGSKTLDGQIAPRKGTTTPLRREHSRFGHEYRPLPDRLAGTLYWGRSRAENIKGQWHGKTDTAGRIYHKKFDKVNEDKDTAEELPNKRRCARDEVMLHKNGLEKLGLHKLDDLLTFNFAKLAKLFCYDLPIVLNNPIGGVRAVGLRRAAAGTWSFIEPRQRSKGRHKKCVLAFDKLNKKATQAWQRFARQWRADCKKCVSSVGEVAKETAILAPELITPCSYLVTSDIEETEKTPRHEHPSTTEPDKMHLSTTAAKLSEQRPTGCYGSAAFCNPKDNTCQKCHYLSDCLPVAISVLSKISDCLSDGQRTAACNRLRS
jgi:hypothetical protein